MRRGIANYEWPGPLWVMGKCTCSMREFCGPAVPIYMYGKDGQYTLKTMGEVSVPYVELCNRGMPSGG